MTKENQALSSPTNWPELDQLAAGLRFIIVPGLHDSGPDHWQTRWQRHYSSFERVDQEDWETPALNAWANKVDQVIRQRSGPAVIIAHSFGCLASVYRYSRDASLIAGLLLVAPADPEKFQVVQQLPQQALSCPSTLISSSNDPWMDSGRAIEWARKWGSKFIDGGAIGHVNTASELGDWQFGLDSLVKLVTTL